MNGKYVADKGDIYLSTYKGELTHLGCSISKQVHRWLPTGSIIVSKGRGYNTLYFVDPNDCSTQEKIRKFNVNKEKDNITFSPDGTKYFYFKKNKIYSQNKGRQVVLYKLYIADRKTNSTKLISDSKYDPKNPTWAPDSKKIVFDVKCQSYKNIRHIALYEDKEKDTKIYTGGEQYGNHGNISNSNPYWSKNGRYLLYDSIQYLASNPYSKVVWDLHSNERWLKFSILYKRSRRDVGTSFKWIDNEHILLGTVSWLRIYNLKGEIVENLSTTAYYLYINLN